MKKLILKLLKTVKRIFTKLRSSYIRRNVKECGNNLRVNGKSRIAPNTYLGNNVSFND